jgi:methyl-accepting chemotaxis protein
LESPSDGLKELIQTHTTTVAEAVLSKLMGLQYDEYEKLGNTVLSQLKEQAHKLLDLVGQRTLAFTQLGDPLRVQVSEINAKFSSLSSSAQSISDAISALAKNTPRPEIEELSEAVKALVSALAQRDEAMLERLKALDDARTKLEAVAIETHSTAQTVAGFGTRLDAVPEERRTVEGLAASIKELAQALVQRDTLMLNNLQSSLLAHSQELKTEIRQPRTIKFVEAIHLPDGDGQTRHP